jgi:hypothetical protein
MVVHDGDRVGLQAFHGIGDQEADRIDGGRRKLGAAAQTNEHGSRGPLLVVHQQTVFRHHNHHAGGLHLIQLADGAGQFALDGAQVIGALDEIRNAEIGFVENLESDAVALGDALGGELHSHEMHLVGRHIHRAVGAGAIRHFGVIERRDDLGGLAVVEFAVQQRSRRGWTTSKGR